MPKIKKFLKSIRIEEYVLLVLTLFLFLIISIFLNKQEIENVFNFGLMEGGFFEKGFQVISWGVRHYVLVFSVFFLYFLVRFYLYTGERLASFFDQNKNPGFLKNADVFKNPFSFLKKNMVKILYFLAVVLRPFLTVIAFWGLELFLLGYLAVFLRGNLFDGWLMQIDKMIFGFYPFMGSYYQVEILLDLIPFLNKSYLILGVMISVTWILLFFSRKRKLFSRFLISMALSLIFALIFWIVIPANSPRYLNNIYHPERIINGYQEQIDDDIKLLIKNNSLDERILNFHNGLKITREDYPPISTIPSMHVAWALIILYYLYLFNQRTLYFTLPWFFFSSLGAVYTGQHYFVDVILSIPLTFLIIWFAFVLSNLEKKYYFNEKYENMELKIKKQVWLDLEKILKGIVFLFNNIKDQFKSVIKK